MKQLVFLTYLNRSGSTFLSGMLDEYEDIGVTLEAGFPDGIMYKASTIKSQNDIETYLDRLFKDHKFNGWHISRENLKARLLQLNHPATFSDIFPIILDEYFMHSKAKVYIFKSSYLGNIEKVMKLFPQAKVILLLRNPFAIFNSQKSTKGTKNRRYMSNCPVKFSISCRMALALSLRYENQDWFYKIRYEDLIANPEGEIKGILAFLNASERICSCERNYFDRLPPDQKEIHENITSDPIGEKISSWRKSLHKDEIWIIQRLLSKILFLQGYDLKEIEKIGFSTRLGVFFRWLNFIIKPKGKFTMIKTFLKGIKNRQKPIRLLI